MKQAIIIVTAMLACGTQAQDYYLVDVQARTNIPAGVTGINLRDRTGDWRDYRATGLPIPSALPALVDAQSGDAVTVTGTLAQAKADLRSTQKANVVTETPAFFQAFTMTTNTMSLIGTNRNGFGLLRYDGTKLTAAQREQYQTECIQYLAARVQLLERELKRKKVVNIKPLVEEVQ
jgi:hypothetical protein